MGVDGLGISDTRSLHLLFVTQSLNKGETEYNSTHYVGVFGGKSSEDESWMMRTWLCCDIFDAITVRWEKWRRREHNDLKKLYCSECTPNWKYFCMCLYIIFWLFFWCSTSITLYFSVRCQMFCHSQNVIVTFVLHSLCLPLVNLSSSPPIPPPAISPRVWQWHHRLTVRVMWLRMCLLRCVLCCRPITTTTGESISINTGKHAYLHTQSVTSLTAYPLRSSSTTDP